MSASHSSSAPRPSEFEQSSCAGKEAMAFDVARATAEKMRKRNHGAVQHYKCPICGEWHVGRVLRRGRP